MKRFHTITCGIISAICLASCAKEENGPGTTILGHIEFSATIDNACTKVSAGEFGENTLSLLWSVGDCVKLVYGTAAYDATVTAVSPDGSATIASDALPVGETPSEAWYPGEYYTAEGLSIPKEQHHGKLPVILKGTASEGNILFKADGSTLLCYPLTGDIAIKSAALYLTDIPALWGGAGDAVLEPSYTLSFDEPLQLSDEPVNIYFAVPTEDKIATLEVTADAPDGSLVEDYKYYRRKLTALSFSSGNVQKMPVLGFDKATIETESAYKYVYGTANDGEGNLKSGNNTPVTLAENYASIGFVANNATQTRININYTIDPLNVGNARYAAFKSDIPYVIYNPGYGYSPVGNNIDTEKLTGINTDLRICSQMWQGQYMMEATGRNSKITYSGEIDCGDHTYIRYYDLLGIWSVRGNNNYYESTVGATPRTEGTTAIISAMTYQDAEGNNVIAQDEGGKNYLKEPIAARIYWFGFFNSIEEMEAFAAAHQ